MDSTAAQVQWSNGVCERHNAVIKHTLAKVREEEPTSDVQLLLDTAAWPRTACWYTAPHPPIS